MHQCVLAAVTVTVSMQYAVIYITSLYIFKVEFYIFTIMAFVYVYVSELQLVQLPTFGQREHLIAFILM